MAPGDWRLFVALPVPADISRALDDRLAPLCRRFPDARWIPAASRHVTLVFLGWVAPDRVDPIGETVRLVAARHHTFEIGLAGGGGAARRGEVGVAWVKVRTGSERVSALASDLAAVLPAPPLGGRPAGERPHITVARRASAALIRALEAFSGPGRGLAWTASEVVVFRSHLETSGARYEAVHEARLAAQATRDT